MTRDQLLALGEHPADVERVLARLDDDTPAPEGAMRLRVNEISEDGS
jgi:hypothetical protein